jgi:hypothetical protein
MCGDSRLYRAFLPKPRAKGIDELELDNRSKPLAEGGYYEDHIQPPQTAGSNFPHAFCMHATCSVLLTTGWGLSFGSPDLF